MGGVMGGARACQVALDRLDEHLQTGELNDGIFTQINQAILEETRFKPRWAKMGTTLVALRIKDGRGLVLGCGNSRAFLIRGSQVGLLTLDQSIAAMLFQAGERPLKEFPAYDFQEYYEYIRNYKGREVLSSSLGHPLMEIFSSSFDVQTGDRFLLCSDAQGKYLAYPDFIQIITSGKGLGEILMELNQETLSGMEKKIAAESAMGEQGDNITGILGEPQA